jgi:hypothetical protein
MGRENDRTLGDRVETVRQEQEEAQSPSRLRQLAEDQLAKAEATDGLYGKTEANTARKTLAELAADNQQSEIEADRIREELGIPAKLVKPAAETLADNNQTASPEKSAEGPTSQEVARDVSTELRKIFEGIDPSGVNSSDLLRSLIGRFDNMAYGLINGKYKEESSDSPYKSLFR